MICFLFNLKFIQKIFFKLNTFSCNKFYLFFVNATKVLYPELLSKEISQLNEYKIKFFLVSVSKG